MQYNNHCNSLAAIGSYLKLRPDIDAALTYNEIIRLEGFERFKLPDDNEITSITNNLNNKSFEIKDFFFKLEFMTKNELIRQGDMYLIQAHIEVLHNALIHTISQQLKRSDKYMSNKDETFAHSWDESMEFHKFLFETIVLDVYLLLSQGHEDEETYTKVRKQQFNLCIDVKYLLFQRLKNFTRENFINYNKDT